MPERRFLSRLNPNIETRNSKQIRIPNDRMIKTNSLNYIVFVIETLLFLSLFRISKFGFRIFDHKTEVFGQALSRLGGRKTRLPRPSGLQ